MNANSPVVNSYSHDAHATWMHAFFSHFLFPVGYRVRSFSFSNPNRCSITFFPLWHILFTDMMPRLCGWRGTWNMLPYLLTSLLAASHATNLPKLNHGDINKAANHFLKTSLISWDQVKLKLTINKRECAHFNFHLPLTTLSEYFVRARARMAHFN